MPAVYFRLPGVLCVRQGAVTSIIVLIQNLIAVVGNIDEIVLALVGVQDPVDRLRTIDERYQLAVVVNESVLYAVDNKNDPAAALAEIRACKLHIGQELVAVGAFEEKVMPPLGAVVRIIQRDGHQLGIIIGASIIGNKDRSVAENQVRHGVQFKNDAELRELCLQLGQVDVLLKRNFPAVFHQLLEGLFRRQDIHHLLGFAYIMLDHVRAFLQVPSQIVYHNIPNMRFGNLDEWDNHAN